MDLYSTKHIGRGARRAIAALGLLGALVGGPWAAAAAGPRVGAHAPFCLPDDIRWAGRLTGCREIPDGIRPPERLELSDRRVEGLFRAPGSRSEFLRLGPWALDPPDAPAPAPAREAAPETVGPPTSDQWLTIQLDQDGFYMFLGDPLAAPEDAPLVGQDPYALPSGIGIQKKWQF